MKENITRIRLTVDGIVQGVGFRPFLHRLAEKHGIAGWVRNTSEGLEGELEGNRSTIELFLKELNDSPPPLALIENIKTFPCQSIDDMRTNQHKKFIIKESRTGEGHTLVSPDISICPDCAKELYDPSDRRYRYPFINCTNCGPRYTIIKSLPYDRSRTVMDQFPMCRDCEKEYNDINDRRYHAQPDCCDNCGPHVFYTDGKEIDAFISDTGSSSESQDDPFRRSQELLSAGGILAVKGIGGIHLACDAYNENAVKRLRERKHRPEKPLAVMCFSLEAAKRICRITCKEERLLTSPERPIILLAKIDTKNFAQLSFSPRIGVMLPYTPLHMLLLDGRYDGPDTVVMTSGNPSGCPVLTKNDEALQIFENVADGFLLHDRDIQNRCDDSLIMEWQGNPYFLRKSRGYAPRPIKIATDADGIFAMGAELKASFALGRGKEIFISPYIGDLKNAETASHYTQTLKTYTDLFKLKPSVFVCDTHPDYISSRYAKKQASEHGIPLVTVQHHWAHMTSCMADNGLDEQCFGIIWDGTGLGSDGSIWGGEFLSGGFEKFTRTGSIRPIRLAGGDRAVYEIERIAFALLKDAGMDARSFIPMNDERFKALSILTDSDITPKASSIGRLFDGISSLLLRRASINYEGEGAALLEAMSPSETPEASLHQMENMSYTISFYSEETEDTALRIFDTRPMIREIAEDIKKGKPEGETARRFMSTLCLMALKQCLFLNRDQLPVVLSGGVFQNRFLLSGITSLLTESGFRVYTHRRVSPGDEGICLGQLAVAQRKRSDLICV